MYVDLLCAYISLTLCAFLNVGLQSVMVSRGPPCLANLYYQPATPVTTQELKMTFPISAVHLGAYAGKVNLDYYYHTLNSGQ